MKKLGVIGGLGPMATAYFLQLLTQMSDAATDQGHMEILLHSKPQIPDRTRFILGLSREDPLPMMAQTGIDLRSQGAALLAVPCVTAHYFRERLEEAAGIPVLDAIGETARCAAAAGIRRAGFMATDGTVESGLLQRAFGEAGVECIFPDRESQGTVMDMIYGKIKAGKPADLGALRRVAQGLLDAGAEVAVLACTELSLVKQGLDMGEALLDVMEVLAGKAVMTCGHLKREYACLLRGARRLGERRLSAGESEKQGERSQYAEQCIGLSGQDGAGETGEDGVL